jgi:hypothetical protein
VTTEPAQPEWFMRHSFLVGDSDEAWIAGSGAKQLRALSWDVSGLVAPGTYRVRLVFARGADDQSDSGEVQISLQQEQRDSVVLAKPADELSGIIVREISSVSVDDVLELTLTPAQGAGPAGLSLCGIAMIAE